MPIQRIHCIHRTAIFTLHHPTGQVRAALDAVFAQYTAAYTEALHCFAHFTPAELYAMATFETDAHGQPRTSARRLEPRLFAHQSAALLAALQPLEGGLRESLRRHVARTFLSYAALAMRDATTTTIRDKRRAAQCLAVASSRRSVPTRLRAHLVEPQRHAALARLAMLADGVDEERACIAQLQRTAQPSIVSLPFCRVDAERNCGLFYNPETRRFYARLYVMSYHSRYARHITAAGQYVDLRSGALYMREQDAAMWQGIQSFGTGRSSILVPLELGRWHEEPLRFTNVVLLPQRQREPLMPLSPDRPERPDRPLRSAVPVSAWLVKHGSDYRLHVTFQLPAPPRLPVTTLLGVDRGIRCLAAGAVLSADGRTVLDTFRVDGETLSTMQQTVEQHVRQRQQRGQVVRGRQRTRMADAAVHAAANQIVELARCHQAQVVVEDLHDFAAPAQRLVINPTTAGTAVSGRSGRSERRRHHHSNPEVLLSRRQYQRLLHAINAKLALVGLPRAREVGASYTSLTCSHCGHIDRANRQRESLETFRCVACGHEADADEQAGISIARKALWLDLRIREARAGLARDRRTPWSAFVRQLLADAPPPHTGRVSSVQPGFASAP